MFSSSSSEFTDPLYDHYLEHFLGKFLILKYFNSFPEVLSYSTIWKTFSVSFSSVQSLSYVWLFATPWTAAHQVSLSITNFWSLPTRLRRPLQEAPCSWQVQPSWGTFFLIPFWSKDQAWGWDGEKPISLQSWTQSSNCSSFLVFDLIEQEEGLPWWLRQ